METVMSRHTAEIPDAKHEDALEKLLERWASRPTRPVGMLETRAPIHLPGLREMASTICLRWVTWCAGFRHLR